MKILAVDSCSGAASCALVADGKLVAEAVINDKKTHSVTLLPQIKAMLEAADTDICEIDFFAATVGPGSFTGQRIGIATVKGLAHAADRPCVGVSALEALVYNLPLAKCDICPIMDARREQVYTATFRGFARVRPDRAIALSALLEEQAGADTVFLGDGAPVFRDMITEAMGGHAFFAPPHLLNLRASSAAALAMEYIEKRKPAQDGFGVCEAGDLVPFYLRLSQAERMLNERTAEQK